MADILFVGRQPDRYAQFWFKLTLRNVVLDFAKSQHSAIQKLSKGDVGTIIVDSGSLQNQASTVCRALRKRAPRAGMICITPSRQETLVVVDYQLHSPVKWDQLAEALKQAGRRDRQNVLMAGDFRLDYENDRLVGPCGAKQLTPKQNDLLLLLLKHAGQVVSRSAIMQQVWQISDTQDTRTLEVHVNWLRQKIEPDPQRPRYLVTKRGVGYALYPEGRPAEPGSPPS